MVQSTFQFLKHWLEILDFDVVVLGGAPRLHQRQNSYGFASFKQTRVFTYVVQFPFTMITQVLFKLLTVIPFKCVQNTSRQTVTLFNIISREKIFTFTPFLLLHQVSYSRLSKSCNSRVESRDLYRVRRSYGSNR